MTERQARERGFQYTGISDWDGGKVKERLEIIRKQGYKAYFITIPPNPLSRGHHGNMYSVYTEPKYQQDNAAKDLQACCARHATSVAALQLRHAGEMEACQKEQADRVSWLEEHGYSLE